jgi:hypothetical protein
MFVNPKTKAVLKERKFFGFEIPFYYADFHSKNKKEGAPLNCLYKEAD